MNTHGKALLLGACGTVQGRFGRWFHPIFRELNEEFDQLIKERRWLASQPFDTIHHVIRFGALSADKVEIKTVDKAQRELPTASMRAMSELREVLLDKDKLRIFLREEIIRSLKAISESTNLPSLV